VNDIMDVSKKNIVGKFHRNCHTVDFILAYIIQLNAFDEVMNDVEDQKDKDKVIASSWSFKRWFWSFIENAVVLHTTLIEVKAELLENYDVDLIIKTLKSFGVRIVVIG